MSRKPMSFIHGSANYIWSTTSILGKGASGIVYRGVNKATGEPIAVKTFPNHLRHYQGHIREFDVFSKLNHENIVKLLAIEEDLEQQSKVLVMELCAGGSLGYILDDPVNQFGLEEEEFLTVLKDLSSGMKYLRDTNITHRDLKPANIMKYIAEDGRSIYKLSDFGAARELKDDQPFMSLHGTEEYLHPDMYKPAVLRYPITKSFKATVDLWSIGVTLYHTATGTLPFRPYGGRTNRETMIKITDNKQSGVISGVQSVENGPIEWNRELPRTCCLSIGLQKLVTPLLARLLESSSELMWTFEKFFDTVTDIISRQPVHCLFVNESKEMTIYLKRDSLTTDQLYPHLVDQAGVERGRQWLVFEREQLADGCPLPETSRDRPLLLLCTPAERDSGNSPTEPGDTHFPPLSTAPMALEHDSAVAKSCCSVGHVVARRVERWTRCHSQLCQTPPRLLAIMKTKASLIQSNYERVSEDARHLGHRLGVLHNSQGSICRLLQTISPGYMEATTLRQVIQDKKHSCDAMRQQLNSTEHCLQSLQAGLARLPDRWSCSPADRWKEKSHTFVTRIRESWQVLHTHKLAKKLSFHDEQFHLLEKVKIQQTSQKLVSLLNEQNQFCQSALVHFNKWHRDLEAVRSQCLLVEEELANAEMMVKAFKDSLLETEEEAAAVNSKLTPPPQAPLPSVSSSLQTGSTASLSRMNMLKDVKQDQKEIMSILNENNHLNEEIMSLMEQMTFDPLCDR